MHGVSQRKKEDKPVRSTVALGCRSPDKRMAVTFCRQLKASSRNAPSLKRRGSHAVEETSNWILDFKTGNASTVAIIQT